MLARTAPAIRTARSLDVADLLRVEHACFDTDRLSRRSFSRLVRRESACILVAETDGRISGYALLLFRRNSRSARLYSIAVDPQYAGGGLGARLMAAGEAASLRRGCTQLRLEVKTTNRHAIALYERLGFVRVATRPGYYADGGAAYRYVKRLAATGAVPAGSDR